MQNEEVMVEMTADEKMNAIERLTINIEDDFVQLGQLLSEIKKAKLFKFFGYKTFKEFVEDKFNLSGGLANKLQSNYVLFLEDIGISEDVAKVIGLDKLNTIKPVVKRLNPEDVDVWIDQAKSLTITELREDVKLEREKNKKLSLKDVFVDQYVEKMVTYFNCSRKELQFKVALYFQDEDLNLVRARVKIGQRRFEEDQVENE